MPKLLKATQIVAIYTNYKKFGSIARAARAGQVSTGQAYFTLDRIETYLKGVRISRNMRTHGGNYIEAAKIIKGLGAGQTLVESGKSPVDEFALAQQAYEKAVMDLVSRLVSEKFALIQNELETLRAENAALKKIQEAAKESNLVTNLRRHFGLPA